jgi:hypothetical protein
MLWIGELTNLERLAMASFVANGHPVHLYAYEEMVGVPAGVTVMDANAILPEERIFRYSAAAGKRAGSLAPFSDIFRFKLLYDRGGWWVDADVVCLRPFDFEAHYVFGYQDELINNAVLRLPEGSEFGRALYEGALMVDESDEWASTGPLLLTAKVREFGLDAYALAAPVFYPIYHLLARMFFRADSTTELAASLIQDSYAVHFWNAVTQQMGFDKNAAYPATSIFERLKTRYGIGAER